MKARLAALGRLLWALRNELAILSALGALVFAAADLSATLGLGAGFGIALGLGVALLYLAGELRFPW